LALKLQQNGFKAKALKGGYDEWVDHGMPIEKK
jgi:rhodanese-related sulfurtransferase